MNTCTHLRIVVGITAGFLASPKAWASGWDLQLVFPEASPNAQFLSPRTATCDGEGALGAKTVGTTPVTGIPPVTVWPATRAELGLSGQSGSSPSRPCSDSLFPPVEPSWLRLGLSTGAFPGGKLYPLGQPFETFRGNWGAMRVRPEQGLAYSEVPPAASIALAYAFNPHLFVYSRASLKRDLRAWHDDPLGRNWPTAADEIEMNEPTLGYAVADASWGRALLGRFPLHMGPSPEFSLLVGGQKPAHDAVLLTLKAPAFRYHFAFASLNAWLQGTPLGDTASFNYPVGSEAWRQRNYAQGDHENAHLRVYDARAKSLNVHRLEAVFGNSGYGLVLAISEMQIIGGKVPDLLDVQPFAVWHNDFKYGYSNNLVHLDFRLDYRPRSGVAYGTQDGPTFAQSFALFGELALDDLPYAPKEGEEQKAITGWLLGLEHAGTFGAGRNNWLHRLHVVKTDPRLYHFTQPYNTYFARQILNTNVQPKSDPNFIDRLVIDYPVGYIRGGDAYDFWYRASLNFAPRPASGRGLFAGMPWLRYGATTTLKLAYLQHGAITEATLPKDIDVQAETPSGTPLEEWRAEWEIEAGLTRTLTLLGGAGARRWQIGDGKGEVDGQPGSKARGHHVWGQMGLVWRWGNGL